MTSIYGSTRGNKLPGIWCQTSSVGSAFPRPPAKKHSGDTDPTTRSGTHQNFHGVRHHTFVLGQPTVFVSTLDREPSGPQASSIGSQSFLCGQDQDRPSSVSSVVLLKCTVSQNHPLTRAQEDALVTGFPGMPWKDSDSFHPLEVGTETGKRSTWRCRALRQASDTPPPAILIKTHQGRATACLCSEEASRAK